MRGRSFIVHALHGEVVMSAASFSLIEKNLAESLGLFLYKLL